MNTLSLHENTIYFENQFEKALGILNDGNGVIPDEALDVWFEIDLNIRLEAIKEFNGVDTDFYQALMNI